MPMAPPLSIRDVYAEGWRLTRRHWAWTVLPSVLFYWAMRVIDAWMERAFPADQGSLAPIAISLYLLAFLLSMSFGLLQLMLAAYDRQPLGLSVFLDGARRTVPLFVNAFLYFALTVLGLLLFLAPGIKLGARLGLAWVAMLDPGRRLGPFASFKATWSLTHGRTALMWAMIIPVYATVSWMVLDLPLWADVLLDALSAVAFCWFSFAELHVYRQLMPAGADEVPVTA